MNLYPKFYIFFPLFIPRFTCVDSDPYSEYGSGFTKLLNTDPIRIHNTGFKYFFVWIPSLYIAQLPKFSRRLQFPKFTPDSKGRFQETGITRPWLAASKASCLLSTHPPDSVLDFGPSWQPAVPNEGETVGISSAPAQVAYRGYIIHMYHIGTVLPLPVRASEEGTGTGIQQ